MCVCGGGNGIFGTLLGRDVYGYCSILCHSDGSGGKVAEALGCSLSDAYVLTIDGSNVWPLCRRSLSTTVLQVDAYDPAFGRQVLQNVGLQCNSHPSRRSA